MGFLYFNQRRWSTMFLTFFFFLMVAANFYVGRPKIDPETGEAYPLEDGKSLLGSGDWIMWFVLLLWMVVLYIVDLMFLTDREFVYDPNYSSWLEKCGYEHFRT